MKRTACVYHRIDLDGWMSAAIVNEWWHSITHLSNEDTIDFIGFNYGDIIPNLSKFDAVIMCDISFPFEEMFNLQKRFRNSECEFTWIDHHISSIKEIEGGLTGNNYHHPLGLRDVNFSACELTWMHFFPKDKMPEIVRLIGRYDCFGHKGTSEEKTVLRFQYGARARITNWQEAYEYLVASYKDHKIVSSILLSGESIYGYLVSDAKQTYEKSFPVVFDYPSDAGITTVNFLCVNRERFNPINFGIDYHKDGADGFACFHLVNGKWAFSLYNDNGRVDCSLIAKKLGGGGHAGASGFVYEGDIFKLLFSDTIKGAS